MSEFVWFVLEVSPSEVLCIAVTTHVMSLMPPYELSLFLHNHQ